jgi:glycosyltransferase involved in cell wall biosynthesis
MTRNIGDTEFSICSGVKDRNEFLIQALPTWLRLPATEIIIVDWSSEHSVKDAIAGIRDERIKIIRVKNESKFGLSKVWNLAISSSSNDCIMKLDGDIIVKPKRLVRHTIEDNTFYVGARNIHGVGTYGSIWLTREMFNSCHGYNERLSNWGYEDDDFYIRLLNNGFNLQRWSKRAIKHIDHPDSFRLPKKREENKQIAELKTWSSEDSFYEPEIEYIT